MALEIKIHALNKNKSVARLTMLIGSQRKEIWVFIIIMIDWLVFNANFSNISTISWREQIIYIRHLQDPKK
jgi:hypothetical protein